MKTERNTNLDFSEAVYEMVKNGRKAFRPAWGENPKLLSAEMQNGTMIVMVTPPGDKTSPWGADFENCTAKDWRLSE